MKIINNLKFAAPAAVAVMAVTLMFQTQTTRADDHRKAVPPSNPFVVLLEGTFVSPPDVVPDFGLDLPNLNNGIYKQVPMYNIDSGVPGPTDEAVGTFYALGGEGFFAYDLLKGALTAMMIMGTSVTAVTPDGEGGIYITGTYELDILEATGIYRSFAGGHIHMVDVLHVTPGSPIVRVEHCFCYISREHGKP